MLDSPTQPSLSEWLDLRPELLSIANRLGAVAGEPVPAATSLPETGAVASIGADTVLAWGGGMAFLPSSPPQAPLQAATHGYRPPAQGGTQQEAWADILQHGTRGW